MLKNEILKYIIVNFIILFIVCLFAPYKERISCADNVCTVKRYYSLYHTTENIDISNGLKIYKQTQTRGLPKAWTITPLDISYRSASEARKALNQLNEGNRPVNKYSLYQIIATLLSIAALTYLIKHYSLTNQ